MTPEERAEYMKEYRKNNLEYIRRYKRGWYQRNKEQIAYRRRLRYYTDEAFRKYELERHRKRKEKGDGLA